MGKQTEDKDTKNIFLETYLKVYSLKCYYIYLRRYCDLWIFHKLHMLAWSKCAIISVLLLQKGNDKGILILKIKFKQLWKVGILMISHYYQNVN